MLVAMTAAALPLTMAIESLCLSHAVSLFSPVMAVMRLPGSATNMLVEAPITPLVSKERGSNL